MRDERGGGPEPFGKLSPHETNCSPSTNESSDRAFFYAPQAPAAAAAITPRALAEPLNTAVEAATAAAAPASAPAETSLAAALAARASAGAATAAPPAPSAAATAPAKAHEETRGAGNTSAPETSFCTVAQW